VLGDQGRAGQPAKALAVVRFDGPGDRHLRVDVAVLGSADGTVQSRELEFREEDLLPDRYEAAGLAIVALAGRAAAENGPSEPRPARPRPEEERPLSTRWALGAGGVAGGGLVSGPARAGGWATASVSSPRSGFLGTMSASYSTTVTPPPPGLSVQWITLGAGGGLFASIPPLRALARARVEAFFDWTVVTARDPGAKVSDTGHVLDLSGGSALELVWPADTTVALVGGGSAFLRTHGTTIQVHQHPVATLPMGGFLGTIGLELRLR
jgi:hypothetical protein